VRIHDAHCHFFSPGFFEALADEWRRLPGRTPAEAARSVPELLGWDDPGSPERLADRWVAELDRHGVARAVLIASAPGDEASVAAAVARHPARFVGAFMLNAAAPDAAARADRAFGSLGLRVACLFPALHRYRLDDEAVARVFEVARAHRAAVFAHCGVLTIGARRRLGLPSAFDLRLGDPLALAVTASHFPEVPVIVPHFGAGFFREALMAAEACPTIHFDTSSSNAWTKYVPGLTLAGAFRQALAVVGPERLLFGTDSSYFPRGWQRSVFEAQRAALDEIGVERAVQAQIFGGTFERLFGA
jgi:predicted TIM-barrel fold metal-dependent hydrolase